MIIFLYIFFSSEAFTTDDVPSLFGLEQPRKRGCLSMHAVVLMLDGCSSTYAELSSVFIAQRRANEHTVQHHLMFLLIV